MQSKEADNNSNASYISNRPGDEESTAENEAASEARSAEASAGVDLPAARNRWIQDNETKKKRETKQPLSPQVVSSEVNEAERITDTGESSPSAPAVDSDGDILWTGHHNDETKLTSTTYERQPDELELWEEVEIHRNKFKASLAVESSLSPDELEEQQEEEKQDESPTAVEGGTTTTSDFDRNQEQEVQPGAVRVYPSRSPRNDYSVEDISFRRPEESSNNHSTDYMVEANLVEDEEPPQLVKAEPMVEPKPTRLKAVFLALGGALIIVVLVVGLSVGLTQNKNNDETPTTASSIPDSPSPTMAPADSASPTMAPTIDWMDFVNASFNGSLSDHAIEMIKEEGTIPTELALFTNLEELRLDSNQLFGTIPTELLKLSKLTKLALHNNNLNGTIPTELALLTNMEGLWLYSNKLTGTIPNEFSKLAKLTWLDVRENYLNGTIPVELAQLNNLEDFALGYNHLSGTIPNALVGLKNLTSFVLGPNKLHGSIPGGLLFSLSKLTMLALRDNNLTGTIPTELALLTNLQELWLDTNVFFGTIPTELSKLSKLFVLSLGDNNLNGTIPTEIALLTKMKIMFLVRNLLSGTVPEELGNLTSLKEFHLYQNAIRGSVPQEMCSRIGPNGLRVVIDCDDVDCTSCGSSCVCFEDYDDAYYDYGDFDYYYPYDDF